MPKLEGTLMHNHLIAPHVQAFFAEYLCQQKRLSPQTIVSCRDTFRLLLTFLRDQTGIEPSALRIADIDAQDRKSTRLNSSHLVISYAVFCLKKKKKIEIHQYIIYINGI